MGHEARVFAGGVIPPAGAPQVSENPFRGDRQSAAEGERTFGVMNCDGCHGGGAVGWVGPSLRDGRWRYGGADGDIFQSIRSEEHTSELQSRLHLVCRLLLEKK